jgi:drug/metabolite transporter (DMT)-like permease
MLFNRNQLFGVIIGLLGTLLLILSGAIYNPDQNYWFSVFVIIASVCYAFNVSIIKKYLQDLNAMSIAVGNFTVIIIPALIVLSFTGFFEAEFISSSVVRESMYYLVLLAIFGTGIAKVMFNRLVQISTPIFSSSVTYTIPIVALVWGVFDGEKLNYLQIIATVIILLGVFLSNRKN